MREARISLVNSKRSGVDEQDDAILARAVERIHGVAAWAAAQEASVT